MGRLKLLVLPWGGLLGLDAPPDVKQAFGYFVIEFSRLEFIVQLLTWSLIDDDLKVGWSLTGGETFGRTLELCARLVRLRTPDDEARVQFEALRERLETVNKRRNQVLHAFWQWDENAEELLTF